MTLFDDGVQELRRRASERQRLESETESAAAAKVRSEQDGARALLQEFVIAAARASIPSQAFFRRRQFEWQYVRGVNAKSSRPSEETIREKQFQGWPVGPRVAVDTHGGFWILAQALNGIPSIEKRLPQTSKWAGLTKYTRHETAIHEWERDETVSVSSQYNSWEFVPGDYDSPGFYTSKTLPDMLTYYLAFPENGSPVGWP